MNRMGTKNQTSHNLTPHSVNLSHPPSMVHVTVDDAQMDRRQNPPQGGWYTTDHISN